MTLSIRWKLGYNCDNYHCHADDSLIVLIVFLCTTRQQCAAAAGANVDSAIPREIIATVCWRLMRVVPRHLFDTWCMMVIGSTTGTDLWQLGKTSWLLGKFSASAVQGSSPSPCNLVMTFGIRKICSQGASIMESETTTHMTAFSVVDSDLEYRLHHVARVKGLHTTYFGGLLCPPDHATTQSTAMWKISRSMGTRARINTTVFMSPLLYDQRWIHQPLR